MLSSGSLRETRAAPSGFLNGIELPAPALAKIRRLAAIGAGYPAIYRTVAEALRTIPDADPDTRRWYALAAEVNDRRGTSFIHYFARSYLVLETWRQTHVRVLPDSHTVQRCSDELAATVLGGVLSGATDRVARFADLGPVETRRITRQLIPGLLLERTVWPAYGQLAWHEADHSLRALVCRWLPFWRSGLPRWLCPTDLFADDSFLAELSDTERAQVRASAHRAGRYARRCVRMRRWAPENLFADS